MKTRLSAALLVSALLAGCAGYTPQPIHPDKTADALAGRTLSDPRLLRFLAAQLHESGAPPWNLSTLSLVAAYERPDMPLAEARLLEAKGGETTAAALPNPNLQLAPTYDTTTTAPPWTVGPVVTFLIQSYGARPARIAQAAAHTVRAVQPVDGQAATDGRAGMSASAVRESGLRRAQNALHSAHRGLQIVHCRCLPHRAGAAPAEQS